MQQKLSILNLFMIISLMNVYISYANVTGTICGKILDITSQQIISNAVVTTDAGGSSISSENGYYCLIHPPGVYTLTVQHRRYHTAFKQIEIVAFESQQLDFLLTPLTFEIEFSPGLNLFSYPVQVSQGFTSFDLFAFLDDSTDVQKLSSYSGVWKTSTKFLGTIAGNNYLITNGQGFLVYMKNRKKIVFTGENQQNTHFNINQGFNLVGINNPAEGLSSWKLLHQLGLKVIKILNYNGKWESCFWFYGQPCGQDFQIQAGKAYIFYMNEAVINFQPE